MSFSYRTRIIKIKGIHDWTTPREVRDVYLSIWGEMHRARSVEKINRERRPVLHRRRYLVKDRRRGEAQERRRSGKAKRRRRRRGERKAQSRYTSPTDSSRREVKNEAGEINRNSLIFFSSRDRKREEREKKPWKVDACPISVVAFFP